MTLQEELIELRATAAALREELADARAILQRRAKTDPDANPAKDTAELAQSLVDELDDLASDFRKLALSDERRGRIIVKVCNTLADPVGREHEMVVALKKILGVGGQR